MQQARQHGYSVCHQYDTFLSFMSLYLCAAVYAFAAPPKTVLRGAFGIFYQVAAMNTWENMTLKPADDSKRQRHSVGQPAVLCDLPRQ